MILDTRRAEPAGERMEPTVPLAKVAAPSLDGTGDELSLSGLLSPRRIILLDQPVKKELVVRTLVEVAASEVKSSSQEDILKAVLQREDEGSTFFNEGAAFPQRPP